MGIINHFADEKEEEEDDNYSGVMASHWHKKYKEEGIDDEIGPFSHLKDEKPKEKPKKEDFSLFKRYKDVD
jgi:hypothetical protein